MLPLFRPGAMQVAANWSDIIQDPEIDAVVIGTWPYLHRTLVLAALTANKHVLTEARLVCHMASLPVLRSMIVCIVHMLQHDRGHICMHASTLLLYPYMQYLTTSTAQNTSGSFEQLFRGLINQTSNCYRPLWQVANMAWCIKAGHCCFVLKLQH